VQNGSASVPGPLSLHVPLKSTYSVVPGADAGAAMPAALSAAEAEGITATPPIMRTAAATPTNPPENRTRAPPLTKKRI
jgi:hypothetical protein